MPCIFIHFPLDICDPLWYENTSTPLHEACWKGLIDEARWLIDKFGYTAFHRGLHGWTPLHSASYGGHIETLQLLIRGYDSDPNEGDDNSVSSLHMASYNGHLPVVKFLVDTCHVSPDQPDSSSNTAVLYSAIGGHSDIVEFFVERNCNTCQINNEGASLSLLACQSGQLALVHRLETLDLFSPNTKSTFGRGILHYACRSANNSIELVKYLLTRYQIAISVKDQCGRTPLHIASWFASSSVVEYIASIQGNEALLVADNSGWSCLHCASDVIISIKAGIVYSKLVAPHDAPIIEIYNDVTIKSNVDFIKHKNRVKMLASLLKKASTCPTFDINATTPDGRSLLHLATLSGSTLLVQALEVYDINSSLNHYGASPVHQAAWSGSTSLLSYVINRFNLNVIDPDYMGHTPLFYSCVSGSINSVKFLINGHNCDANVTDKHGLTCLHLSCRHGHIDIAQYLIEMQHCDINKIDNEGHTLVHHAAWSGSLDLIRYLLNEKFLSPTSADTNKCTALHYASLTLNLPLIKELVATYHLNPHQVNRNGKLPIHYAAESGNILLLELLKSYGSALGLTDYNGCNIIHYSSLNGYTHFIKYVLNEYPNCLELLHSGNRKGNTPLHFACENGSIQCVTFLVEELQCDLTAINTCGETCVIFACLSGNLELVKLLIQRYQLDSLCTDKYGLTALCVAVQHFHILEWYSQEYGADITNYSNNNKYTLAHYAAYNGDLLCLKQLLDKYQCDINATTTDTGSTVLHAACEGGHVPVVIYLTSLPQCNIAAKTSDGSNVLHIICELSGSLPLLKHCVEKHHLDMFTLNNDGKAPIHYACKKGRLELVRYIIEHSPLSLEQPGSSDGLTPFLISVEYNQLEIMKYLISKKCNLLASNDKGFQSGHIAAKKGHLNSLEYLIENKYCNPNAVDHQFHSPLHVAVLGFSSGVVEYLLSKATISVDVLWLRKVKCLSDTPTDINNLFGVHIDGQDEDGNTPLHLACQKHLNNLVLESHLSVSSLLIANNKGQTPLHVAAAAGGFSTDSVETFFSFCGRPTHYELLTARDNEGCTVFHVACSNGHLNFFRYFCGIYSQGVYLLDNRQRGLLHAACEGRNAELVEELIEKHGLDPQLPDEDGITCLHILATLKSKPIWYGADEVYLYLSAFCDPMPLDNSGRTPLHYACSSGYNSMGRYLVDNFSCKPDDPDFNGYTSVHAACEAGCMYLVRYFLVDLKCNAQAETNDLKTLLYFASKSLNVELIQFLHNKFNLKPRLQDIEIAQSVNPDSSVVEYLQKIYDTL